MDNVQATHGFWVGFFFSINSIIGAGILAVPWVYDKGGLALGSTLQVIAAVLALILGFQMLEIMSRTEALVRQKEETKPSSDETDLLEDPTAPTITTRKFDMTEMVSLFCDNKTRNVYITVFALTIYSNLTAYCTIFAASLTEFVPIFGTGCEVGDGISGKCRVVYLLYLAVFAGLMLYISVRGYQEQVELQIVMAVLRFVIIGLIIGTVIGDISTEKYNEGGSHNDLDTPTMWKTSLAGVMFPILFLAITFHNTIPNTSQLIASKTTNLPKVITWAVIVASTLFLVLGVIVPLAVDGVSKMVSLDWKEYSAGHARSHKPWWTYIIISAIGIFPACDIMSVFPIYAIALSDNLIATKYGHDYESKITHSEFLVYRLVVILPPIILATFLYDIVSAT